MNKSSWNKLNLDEHYILWEYFGGRSGIDIAKELGVTWPTIYSRLKKYGATRTNKAVTVRERNREAALKAVG